MILFHTYAIQNRELGVSIQSMSSSASYDEGVGHTHVHIYIETHVANIVLISQHICIQACRFTEPQGSRVIIEQQTPGSESCCIHHMFCACKHAFCTLSSSTVGRLYPTMMHRSWLPDSNSKLSHRNTIAFICSLNAIQIFSESLRSGCPPCLLETLFRS